MRRSTFVITPFFALALGLACTGPGSDDETGSADDTTDATDTTGDTDDEASTSDDTSTTDDDTTSDSTTTDDTTEDTDTADDVPPDPACDTFAQDCPVGEKCVPYATGGAEFDDVKCVPVLGDQAHGEPCTYSNGFDSTDDCDATSWCFNADPDTLEGTCLDLCGGTPEMPECPPMSACSTVTEGVIYICAQTCDPIGQNCEEAGSACYYHSESFGCLPTSEDLPVGEPCGFPNDCAPGNYCIDNDALPECAAAECCTNYCDLGLGDSQCAALPGTACVPFFDQIQAMAIPGYENLGICVLPP